MKQCEGPRVGGHCIPAAPRPPFMQSPDGWPVRPVPSVCVGVLRERRARPDMDQVPQCLSVVCAVVSRACVLIGCRRVVAGLTRRSGTCVTRAPGLRSVRLATTMAMAMGLWTRLLVGLR